MYPAKFTCLVSGRPEGGKDPTCPSWRGIAAHNIMQSRLFAVLLVSEPAEKRVPKPEQGSKNWHLESLRPFGRPETVVRVGQLVKQSLVLRLVF